MRIFKRAMVILITVFSIVTGVVFIAWFVLAQPVLSKSSPSTKRVDPTKLEAHVRVLSEQFHPRDYLHVENLNRCAAYILSEFQKAGATTTSIQSFTTYRQEYKNVIAHFGAPAKERIVIGAHYDAVEGTPGADDNASGVAGLIELAYLLGANPVPGDVELVAYTLEEPPSFGTGCMGSAYHADALAREGVKIRLMIAFEMIGYFTDQPRSQDFPIPLLKLFYPRKGAFIAVVGRWDQPGIVRSIKAAMKGATDLPVYSINAPSFLPGIDFSDHRNYWRRGCNAVMITDTSFYRNPAYHEANDTPDRLDYNRLAKVVIGVYEALCKLSK